MLKNQLNYSNIVQQFADYKMSESGQRPTRLELSKIREAYANGFFNNKEMRKSNKVKETISILDIKKTKEFKDMVDLYQEWKENKKGDSTVTLSERNFIARKILLKKMKEYSDSVRIKSKKMIESKKNSKEDSLLSKIRETRHAIYRANKALRENDLDAVQDFTQQAVDAVDNVENQVEQATGQIDPSILETVQNLKTTVDTLVAQVGAEPTADLGGNPDAGVPAVTGVPAENPDETPIEPEPEAEPAADPNAVPINESMKIVQARIAQREKAFNAMREGNTGNGYSFDAENGIKMTMAGIKAAQDTVKKGTENNRKIDQKDPPSQLDMPSKSELLNGSKSAGNRWPNEKLNLKKSLNESLAERMIDDKIREQEENWNWQKILSQGILG